MNVTIVDVFDESALSQTVKEEVYKCYPDARLAHLKTGGNFPFLARADELNIYIQVSQEFLSLNCLLLSSVSSCPLHSCRQIGLVVYRICLPPRSIVVESKYLYLNKKDITNIIAERYYNVMRLHLSPQVHLRGYEGTQLSATDSGTPVER